MEVMSVDSVHGRDLALEGKLHTFGITGAIGLTVKVEER